MNNKRHAKNQKQTSLSTFFNSALNTFNNVAETVSEYGEDLRQRVQENQMLSQALTNTGAFLNQTAQNTGRLAIATAHGSVKVAKNTALTIPKIPGYIGILTEALSDEQLPFTMIVLEKFKKDVKEQVIQKSQSWIQNNVSDDMKTVEFWTEHAKPSPEFVAKTTIMATALGGLQLQHHRTVTGAIQAVEADNVQVLNVEPQTTTGAIRGLFDTITGVKENTGAIAESAVDTTVEVAESLPEALPETVAETPIIEESAIEETASTLPTDVEVANISESSAVFNNAVLQATPFDAYTTDFKNITPGITAEAIDAWLDSTGINYDHSRINGEIVISWQQVSGIDAKVLLAQAFWESKLGTLGVAATVPGCNMFGYGAYDSNPSACAAYSDMDAVIDFGKKMDTRPYWRSFAKMDEAAAIYNKGKGTKPEGGVYFTATWGAGHKRAETLAEIASFANIPTTLGDAITVENVALVNRPTLARQVMFEQVELNRRVQEKLLEQYKDSLKGFENGRIDVSLLCSPDFAPNAKMRCDAAKALEFLNVAFKEEFGYDLSLTDSYRTYDQQVDLKQRKPKLAAKPGTSMHGLGIAIDAGSDVQHFGSPQHQWMIKNSWRFGWFKPDWATSKGSKPEAWHWEFHGIDCVDQPDYYKGKQCPIYDYE